MMEFSYPTRILNDAPILKMVRERYPALPEADRMAQAVFFGKSVSPAEVAAWADEYTQLLVERRRAAEAYAEELRAEVNGNAPKAFSPHKED